jgi:hypothetical protein
MHALLALYLLSHAPGLGSVPALADDRAHVLMDQGSATSPGQKPPHEWGIGGQFGAGSLGTGVSLQYWVAGLVGVDTRVLLSGSEQFNGIGFEGGHSVEFAPSVIVMFKRPDASKGLDVRPYAGGGVNWAHAGANVSITGQAVNGRGAQFFGGVEFGIAQVPALGVSIEVIRNNRPTALVDVGLHSNTTGLVAFRFFVK